MTTEQQKFWTGFGVGFGVGGCICAIITGVLTSKAERKTADERVRKEKRLSYLDGDKIGYSRGYKEGVEESIKGGEKAVEEAYSKGVDDATIEAQKWMEKHLIQVDSNDPEAIQKAIDEAQKIGNESVSEDEKGNIFQKNDEKRLSEADYEVKNSVEQIFEPSKKPAMEFSGRRYMIQHAQSGTNLDYPIELFADSNGYLSPSQIRVNLRDYEKDPDRLKMVWEAMGWGEYHEDPNEIPSIETINNWNISIDDVNQMMEDVKDDPEPEERTLEFERYLDKVDIYKNNPNSGIKFISEQDYRDESHLDHIEIDYYDVDNVFLQPDSNDRQLEDPITDLGVSNGNLLFENIKPGEDPDVVYVENFGQHFVAEITRYHKSSTGIMDGSAYLNGETSISGGAPRV